MGSLPPDATPETRLAAEVRVQQQRVLTHSSYAHVQGSLSPELFLRLALTVDGPAVPGFVSCPAVTGMSLAQPPSGSLPVPAGRVLGLESNVPSGRFSVFPPPQPSSLNVLRSVQP